MKTFKCCLLLFATCFCLILQVFSSEKVKISLCQITDEYSRWLNLSKEDKASTIMPLMCNISTTKNTMSDSFSLNMPKLNIENSDDQSATYNLNSYGYVTSVKDQGDTGLCWAFAANASLESFMLKNYSKTFDLSERHIDKTTVYNFYADGTSAYNRSTDDGGNEVISGNYYINGFGPVLESSMAFDNYSTYTENQLLSIKPVINVQGISFVASSNGLCNSDQISTMKKNITTYGAIKASVFMDPTYYNYLNGSYYYSLNTDSSNHAITIVGWNDNYAKTNFKAGYQPANNGAWIAKNSWGTDFGDNGYIYISYSDVNVCELFSGITAANTDINEKTYYNDLVGTTGGYLNYNDTEAIIGEFFTRPSILYEKVKEIKFAIDKGVDYRVFINPTGTDFDEPVIIEVGSGTSDYFGYHYVDVSSYDIYLTNSSYAIYIIIDSVTSPIKIPIQYYMEDSLILAKGKPNTSYIMDGSWIDLVSEYPDEAPSLNIKVSTNNLFDSYSNLEISNGSIYTMPTTKSNFDSNLKVDNSATYSLYDGGTLITDNNQLIKTGNTFSSDSYNLNLVVMGDLTSDGQIKINDITKLNDYILGTNNMNSTQLLAADVTRDDSIKINDIAKLNDYLLENISILSSKLGNKN